jgi:hypothetical protein
MQALTCRAHIFQNSTYNVGSKNHSNMYPCRLLHPWIGHKLLSTNAWYLHKGIGLKS